MNIKIQRNLFANLGKSIDEFSHYLMIIPQHVFNLKLLILILSLKLMILTVENNIFRSKKLSKIVGMLSKFNAFEIVLIKVVPE